MQGRARRHQIYLGGLSVALPLLKVARSRERAGELQSFVQEVAFKCSKFRTVLEFTLCDCALCYCSLDEVVAASASSVHASSSSLLPGESLPDDE